jgi:predicted  nucleic acid-binding Zn-ribbon protein
MPNCWPFRSKRNNLEAKYRIRNTVIEVANKLQPELEPQIKELINPLISYLQLGLYTAQNVPLSDKVMEKELSEVKNNLEELRGRMTQDLGKQDEYQSKISKDLDESFVAQIKAEQETLNQKVAIFAQRKKDIEVALNELKNKYQELTGLRYTIEEHISQYTDKLAEYKEAWLKDLKQLSEQLNDLERRARDKGEGNWLDIKYNELKEIRENIKLFETRVSTLCYFDIQKKLRELRKPHLEKCPNKKGLDELMEEINSNPEQLAQVYNLTQQWVVNYILPLRKNQGIQPEQVVSKDDQAEIKKLDCEKTKIDKMQNINAVIDALKEIGNYLGTKKTRLLPLCRSKTFPMKQKIYQGLIGLLRKNVPQGKQATMDLRAYCVGQMNKMDSDTKKKSKKFRARIMNLFDAFDKFNKESFVENFVLLLGQMNQVFKEQEKLFPAQHQYSEPIPNGCKQLSPGVYKVVHPKELTDYNIHSAFQITAQ